MTECEDRPSLIPFDGVSAAEAPQEAEASDEQQRQRPSFEDFVSKNTSSYVSEVEKRFKSASDGEKAAVAVGALFAAPICLCASVATYASAAVTVPLAAAGVGAFAAAGDNRFHAGACTFNCTKCNITFNPLFTKERRSHCRTCKRCICRRCRFQNKCCRHVVVPPDD